MAESKSGNAATDPVASFVRLLFGYRSRIGRGQYWIGVAIVLALAILALGFFATAMNPTGGGSPGLALPLMFFYLLIHSAVTIKRLRDTALSVWSYPVLAFGPFAWLWFSVENYSHIDAMWIVIVGGTLLFFIIPGVLPSKPQPTVLASP